ncbi:MAG: extracellular solute-binding protein [Chloroflexi bacterium]|nr:extracellular solute-binding protein [Chloroflexota bacterium]
MSGRSDPSPWLRHPLSRRAILKAGAALPLGAAMASVASRSALAQDASGETPDYTGVTLQVWSGGTVAPPAEAAAAEWSALTGGQVVVTVVPFGERALKFAGIVAAQDPSVDLLYSGGQFTAQFGDRLYVDLADPALAVDTSIYVPATIPVLTSADGGLRGLPVHSEMEVFIYNRTMFQAAGLDPDAPPATWEELFAAAPALTDGDRYPMALHIGGLYGASLFLVFLNSIPGAKLLSDDRTQVLFGDEHGLRAFQTIEAGLKSGFLDPNLAADVEDYAIGTMFNAGRTASQVNFAELWGYAIGSDPENFPTTLQPDEVGVTTVPGIDAGTSGSVNGFEGFGLNRFGVQQEAALHFLRYLTMPPFQKQMNLGGTLPSSNTAVLEDPEVQAVYPIGGVLAAQGQTNLDRYAAPYDWTPPLQEALGRLYRGEIGAEEAQATAVAGVQDIVLAYLAGA